MKLLPVAYETHLLLDVTHLAYALRIERLDSEIFNFTSHDRAATIESEIYSPEQGLTATSIRSTAGSAVGNLEIRTLNDDSLFTLVEIREKVWEGAKYRLFKYNHLSPSDGVEEVSAGIIGELKLEKNDVVVELRDLRQYFQHAVGSPSSKNCRARLGDAQCKVPLAPLAVTFTVTSVVSNRVFRDNSRTEDADYFGKGKLTWLTGNNAGLPARTVGEYDADGTITLEASMLETVQVGDTATLIPGCRLRLAEDCVAKFDNVLNFRGEPHRPTVDQLTQSPVASV